MLNQMWLNVFVGLLWSPLPDATYLQVNSRRKTLLFAESRIKLTAAPTRERRKSCQVKFPCYFHPRILKEFLLSFLGFCAVEERIKFLCHKQGGFKNTLRLSCRNFVPEVYFEQFLLSHEVGRTNLFKYMSHVHEKRFRVLRFEFIPFLLRQGHSLENEIKTLG